MAAPSPHVGPCKNCSSSEDVCGLGRYRGLCPPCRKQRAAESTSSGAARAAGDGVDVEIRNTAKQPPLTQVCKDLTGSATKLEKALTDRKSATVHAKTVLGEFKECLAIVGRVAQSLVNQSGVAPRDEQ